MALFSFKRGKGKKADGNSIFDSLKVTTGFLTGVAGKISDVVVPGQEDITAKDALLLWSRRTTDGYPGVKIRDFSSSWRDGRAFLSILHRNRPDLVDMRQMRQNSNKQNLESAFSIAERELGVTRLLDTDDVDVPNPDEKSIITYVSSLYDVFPVVPSVEQSLKDNERKLKVEEYREHAASLLTWIRESIKLMLSRNYPSTLPEIKALQSDFNRFRHEDVPPRLEVRNKLLKLFDEIQSLTTDPSQMSIEDEFLPHNVSRMWSRFEAAMQERDMTLQAEVIRLERLHRLAEKVQRDVRYNEETLADLSRRIDDTVRGLEGMHAFEAKRVCDALDRALKNVEESLRGLFRDCQTLQDGSHPQAEQLYKRVSDLQAKVSSLRNHLYSQLLHPLMARPGEVRENLTKTQAEVVSEGRLMETHPAFRHLQDCLDWIDAKQRHLEETKFESDLTLVLEQLSGHKTEHDQIQSFRSHIDKCISDRVNLSSEEQKVYTQKLSKVEVAYSLLSKTSSRRLRCLESLGEFIQLATAELRWLSEREEVELSRDWGATDLNLPELDEYHKSLVRLMESRESQFNAVQEKGGAMILDRHPSARTVEAYMSSLQSQWSWLVQLRWCLEAQIKHCTDHNTFFEEAQHCEQWTARHSELLRNRFCSDHIPIDQAQILLAELQDLQDQIREYDRRISSLVVKSRDIIPLKLRSQRVTTPIRVRTLCSCHQQDVSLQRGEECFLVNNSQRTQWKVKTMTGLEVNVPSVCLLIPPPNPEAIDMANRLKLHHEKLTTQWKTQQRKVRMAAIFAAIRQIKSWDLKKFLAMDPAQREAVWRALKEDGQKLIADCGTSDRDMRKLSEELKECERIYQDLCAKAAAKESHRGLSTAQALLQKVETLSRELSLTDQHLSALLHRPLAQNNLAVQESFRSYREFQLKFDQQESEMRVLQREVKELSPRSSDIESKLNLVVQKTEQMKVLSHFYVDRLKGCEVVISGLSDMKQLVTDFESSLACHDNMTSDLSQLKTLKNELMGFQESLQQHQPKLDQLKEDVESLRTLVERSRPGATKHHDVDFVEKEVDDLVKRWDQVCIQVVERMRSVGSCQNLLTLYHNGLHTEQTWASQLQTRISSQPPLNGDVTDAKRQLEPTMAIYNSLGDRRHQIESVNRHGGQFIREAKIADKRLKQFKDIVEETDAVSNIPDSKKLKHMDGSDVVRDELDRLNKLYMEMVDWANVRLKEISSTLTAHGEMQFQMVIDEEMPLLRTFRAELATRSSMLVDTDMKEYFTQQFEGPTPSQASYGTTPEQLYKSTLQLRPDSTMNEEFAEVTKVIKLQPKSHPAEESAVAGAAASSADLSLTLKAMEHSSTPVSILSTAKLSGGAEQYKHREQIVITIQKEEITPRGQVLHVAAIFNPLTTRKVTLVEALRIGLLDSKTKTFTDPSTRQKLPLTQAAKKGLIDEVVLKQLTSPCGTQDPQTGEELCLLDAIHQKLYDPTSNTFVDVTAGEQVSVPEAMARGIISQSCSRILIGETVEVTSVTRTRAVFTNTEPFQLDSGLSLGTVLEKNLCSEITGAVTHPVSGVDISIMEAVEQGFIDPSCHEIRDPTAGSYMTLTEAVAAGVVDPLKGTYSDKITGQKLSLSVAFSKGLVKTAISLADVVSQGHLTEDGQVFDPSSGQIVTLAEAFDAGIISVNKKCILNPQTDEVMSVKDAVAHKLMTPSGLFVSPDDRSKQPVLKALTLGLVKLAHEDVQFSRSGVKDPRINEVITLSEALKRGIITPQGSYVDSRTGREMSLQQAANSGLVDSDLMKDFNKPTSIKTAQGRHASIAEALKLGIVDAQTGSFENVRTRERHTMQEAVTLGLITAADATKVLSLFSSVTTTTTVLTQIEALQPAGALTISQAVSQGYLNEKTGIFRDPKTGHSVPLDEAIRKGFLKLSPEGTLPPSLSAFRGDIDSQNNRLLSETFMTDTSGGASRTIPIEPGSKKLESSFMTKTDSQYSLTTTTLAKPLLMQSVISETREITLKSVLDPRTGRELDVEDAITRGLISIENGQYTNPITGEKMSLNRAIERGLIKAEQVDGSQKGGIAIKDTRVFSIVGVLHPVTRQRLSVSQALAEGFLDQTQGVYNFVDGLGNVQPMKISQAIEKGYVLVEDIGDLVVGPDSLLRETKSYVLKAVIHPITGKHMSIAEAIAEGILDESEGLYINPLTGESMHIHSAIEKGFIVADLTSVKTDVDKNVNRITTTKLTTLAVTAVVDPRTGNLISVSKAIEDGILNQTKGIYTNPLTGESMTLSDAIDKRLVLAESPEAQSDDPLDKAEISSIHITDEQESHETTLIEDVHSETITMSISGVVDPATLQMISYDRAVDSGILNVRKGLYMNPFTGETMTISAALEKGLIHGEITSTRREDDLLRSAVSSATSTIPLKDITSVIDPRTQEEISFDKAVKDGIINTEKGTYINPRTHTEMDLTKAKELGYLLESKQSSAAQLEKSIEEEDLLQARLSTPRLPKETNKPWSKVDMELEKTVTTDGSTGDSRIAKEVLHYSAEIEQRSDITEDRGMKSQSLMFVDPITGDKMAMDVALEKGLVDSSGSVVDRQTGKKLSPQEALKMGLMVIAGAPTMAGKMVVDAIKDIGSGAKTHSEVITDRGSGAKTHSEVITDRGSGAKTHSEVITDRGSSAKTHSEVITDSTESHLSPSRTFSKNIVQPGVTSTRSGHLQGDDQQVSVTQVDGQRSPGPPVVGVVGKPVTITVDPGSKTASSSERTDSATTISFQQRMSVTSPEKLSSDLTGVQSHKTLTSRSKYANATASEPSDRQDDSSRIPANLRDIQIKTLKESHVKDLDTNWESGILTDQLNSQKLTVKEAGQKGILDSDLLKATAHSSSRKCYVSPDISIDWVQGSITDQSTNETLSVQEALHKGLINMPTASALASISETIAQFTEAEKLTASYTTQPYTLNQAVQEGMYNSKTGQIIDPSTGLEMTVKEALDRQIISSKESTVVDPGTGQEVPLQSAIDSKVFDALTGEFIHKNSGQRMSLLDADSRGLIPSDDSNKPWTKGAKPQIPAKSPTKHNGFESKEEARSARNASPERFPPDSKKLSFAEALDKGLISLEEQQYLDPQTGQRIPLSDAIRDQLISTTATAESWGQQQLSVTQAIDRGLFDDQRGVFHDPETNKDISFQEAIDRGHIDGNLTVRDVNTGEVYSLEEGMKDGRIDAVTGQYVHEESGQKMTLKDAAKLGVLALVGAPVAAAIAAKDSLSSFLSDSKSKDSRSEERDSSGVSFPASTGRQLSSDSKLSRHSVPGSKDSRSEERDGSGASFPASTGRQLSSDSKQSRHSVPGSKSPDSMTLSEAISSGHLSTKTGIFTDPLTGRNMQIRDAVMSGLIDKDSATIQDSETGKAVNLESALQQGILDDRGRIVDSQTGLGKDLKQCINDGTLQGVQLHDTPRSTTASHDKAADKLGTRVDKFPGEKLAELTLVEDKTLTIDSVKDTKTGRDMTLSEAVRRGIVDEEGEYFKDLRTNEVMPLNEAVHRGLVSAATSGSHGESGDSDQTSKGSTITQSTSIKIQSVIDPVTNREMSVAQAVEKGILDMSTGELINTRTGETMAVNDALKQGLLKGAQTPGSVRAGQEATKGYSRDEIDAESEELATPGGQDLISNGVGAGDIKDKRRFKSGSENELHSERTVRAATKDGSVEGKGGLQAQTTPEAKQIRVSRVHDPLTGLKVGLDEAIERGLVDESCSVFNNPVSGAQMRIEDAMKEGLVAGFIQTVSTSQSSVTSKKPAGTYNITGVLDTETGQELSVEEAMNRKILDPSGTYTDPLTGEVIPLAEAMKLGYVFSEKVKETPISSKKTSLQTEPVTFQHAMEHDLINPNAGTFFDESSQKTYSVDEAVRSGLIVASDGKPFEYRGISDTGVTYSFRAALQTGIISSETCLFYDSLTGECISIEAALHEGYLSPVAGTYGGQAIGESIVMLKDGVASSAASTLEEIIDSKTGEKLSLAEAEKRGLVSVVTTNSKMTLSEAITSGLVDSNSGLFHDPVTGESMSIDQAVMSDVIAVDDDDDSDVLGNGYRQDADTEPINIATAISQGYLDTATATFTDPFTQEALSVSQAIQKGLLKPTLTVEELDSYHPEAMDGRRDSTNIVSRSRKVTSDVLDEASHSGPDFTSGLTQKDKTARVSSQRGLSLEETQPGYTDDESIDGMTSHEASSGGRHTLAQHSTSQDRCPTPATPGRMADSYDKLVKDIWTQLQRLQDFEQVLKEATQMGDEASKIQQQLEAHKALHEDILGHQQPILSLVYQAEQLTEHYQEEITPEQVTALSGEAASLKKALEKVMKTSDRRLKHLTAAADELRKVEAEMKKFNTWKASARTELSRQEECLHRFEELQSIQDSQKELMNDIMSHQADVRYISISVQKYVEEAKLHKLEVDSYRADRQRPARSSLISMDCMAADVVKEKLKDVTDDYTDLKHKCSAFGDRLSELNTKQRNFNDATFKMLTWLADTEDKLAAITQDSETPDPGQLEGQLVRIKSLSSEVLSHSGLMDDIHKKGHELTNSFSAVAADSNQVVLLEKNVQEIDARYSSINEAVSSQAKLLQATIIQSQDIQGAIADIQARLRTAQVALSSQQPISLELPLLAQQEQQFRLLAADVHSYADSVESIRQATRDLIKSGDLHVARALEQQLADIDDKFEKVHEACDERGQAIKEVAGKLGEFHDRLNTTQNWLQSRINDVTSSDFNSLPVDEAQEQLSIFAGNKKKNENELAELRELARELREDARTGSPASINKAVVELDKTIEHFDAVVGDKQAEIAQKEKQAGQFEAAKTMMLLWLAQMEARADEFEPAAIEVDVVQQQIDELQPMLIEYEEQSPKVDEVNDLGNALEILSSSADRPLSPIRRFGRPRRIIGLTSPHRRSPSPTFPLSPTALKTSMSSESSGVSSRKSSSDHILLDDLSETQQQLLDINQRYEILGERLSDRQQELQNVLASITTFLQDMQDVLSWLDVQDSELSTKAAGGIPAHEKTAKKKLKEHEEFHRELLNKEGLVEDIRKKGQELLKSRSGVPGLDSLQSQLTDLDEKWHGLRAASEEHRKCLEDAVTDLCDFREYEDQLSKWFNQKEKLMDVLGPVAMEPSLLKSQMEQVKVLKEEFASQEPTLEQFVNTGHAILDWCHDSSSDASAINKSMDAINKSWKKLQGRLKEREKNMESLQGLSGDFASVSRELANWLGEFNDRIDGLPKVASQPDKQQAQKQEMQHLQEEMQDKLPEIIKAKDLCQKLCDTTKDLSTKTDLKAKMAALDKDINDTVKKLESRAAAIEEASRAGEEFTANCQQMLDWIQTTSSVLMDAPALSSDTDLLQRQAVEAKATRQDLNLKEVEIRSLLDKGNRLLHDASPTAETKTFTETLKQMENEWGELKEAAKDREEKIKAASSHAQEFQQSLDKMAWWLGSAEEKLKKISPEFLDKVSIAAKLKELQSLQNEFLKKSHDHDNFNKTAVSLLAAVEDPGNELRHQVGEVNRRWDQLSSGLSERADYLEELQSRLAEIEDNKLDAKHSLTRWQDKLAAHLDMGTAARDPKHIDKIKAIQDDISAIQPQLEYLDKLMEGLNLTEDVNCTDLENELEALRDCYSQLQGEVEELISNMETGSSIVGQFQGMMKKVAADLSDLDNTLSNMKPVSRDENELEAQLQEIQNFQAQLASKSEPLVDVKDQARDLQLAGFVSDPDGLNAQVEALLSQHSRLKDSTDDRLSDIESNIDQVHTVTDALRGLRSKTDDAVSTIDSMKPVGSSAGQIKEQQEELKTFNKDTMEPLHKEISELNSDIEALIKTAPSGVNTGGIDEDLEGLQESWAELNDKVSERERNLGKALLQSGKFKEALASILAWMEETEETVANQKPPAPEFRVVKAQLQEQKLLQRMIDDRASSVLNVKETGQQLLSGLEGAELNRMETELKSLDKRWAALTGTASERMNTLEEVSKLAKSFQDMHEPLAVWLEATDKKFTSLEPKSSSAAGFDKLITNLQQMQADITEREGSVKELATLGKQLQDFCKGDDIIIVQLKIDEVQKQFSDLKNKVDDSLEQMEEALPLAQNFQEAHEKFMDWVAQVEPELRAKELLGADAEEKVEGLLQQLESVQPYLDIINSEGSELAEIAPGDAGLHVEETIQKDNKRFDGLRQQIEKRAEKVNMSRQKSLECVNELDDLMEWFDQGEDKLNTMSAISAEPGKLQKQLAEMKSFNEEVNNQKVRARDAVTSGKKLIRESSKEDVNVVQEKMDQLKNKADTVGALASERLSGLEQALPLARSFQDIHENLVSWLDEVEPALADLEVTTVDAHQVRKQQESIKALKKDVADHKPVIDRLNKTGSALVQLVSPESAVDVQNKLDDDNQRVEDIRSGVRERSNSIDAAMQQSAEFTDKLEDMLETLTTTAESMHNVEPISAFPDKIREQLEENKIVDEDMQMKSDALESVKDAANELIRQAGDAADPAVRDVRQKLEELTRLYSDIQDNCHDRNRALEDALGVSEKFWEDLNTLSGSIKELQDGMSHQEKPALEPEAIREQQEELEVIRDDLAATQADLEELQDTGDQLMSLVGDPERPEIKKNLDDTEQTLNNLNIQVEQRSKDLDVALSRAVTFQQELQKMLVWLQTQEETFDMMQPVASDLETITSQWNDIKVFKGVVDPKHVEVEALNQQAQELTRDSTGEQAAVVREPVREVNQRWDALQVSISDRQRDIQTALLNLGEFDQAYKDFQSWLDTVDQALEEVEPVYGDPKLVELELAKLRVISNDIASHQENLDLLSEAANKMMAREKAPEANKLKKKMEILARDLDKVKDKAAKRQSQLEDARREAQGFTEELHDILMKINDLDAQMIVSQPVGGLPETAKEQLQKFMNTFEEIERLEPSVESLQLMSEKLAAKSQGDPAASIRHNMANLQQRWATTMNRAADRKKKLEDAVGMAGHFHEELNKFIGWLTDTEKTLNNLQPVSRLVDKVTKQIEDHRVLQKDVSGHREAMFALDKMGTHLKYFSQKQDVVLIKNLLTSAQHRWEKIVSRSAERTRHLERGYKEAKQFSDSWKDLIQWLSEAEQALSSDTSVSNEPEKIRAQIAKHKEFQRRLGAKQPVYDSINRAGSTLQTKCPGSDKPAIQALLNDLKGRWNSVCGKSVDRQRKLEEGLLFTGQFNEALEALLDWLAKVEPTLAEDTQVHGDLDTVSGFLETHKAFQQELGGRATTVQFVRKSGKDLIEKSSEDMSHAQSQLVELATLWDRTCKLSVSKQARLEQAYTLAEEFHNKAQGLLDWLADTERQLRFKGPIADEEAVIVQQIDDHKKFEESMLRQEANLRETLNIGQDIMKRCHPDAVSTMKHWLGVLRTRWEELMGLGRQRQRRLTEALTNVRLNNTLLEELLAWLNAAEIKLTDLDRQAIPKDVQIIQDLITQHQDFQNDMSSKQPSVDRLTKADKRKAGSDAGSHIPVFRGARNSARSKIPTIRIDRVDSSGRKTPDFFSRKTPEHFHSQRTPNVSGRRTPDVSGRRTPDVSGRRTPDVSGRRTPDVSGRMTPDHSGRKTPDHTSGRRTPDILSGRRTPEPGFHNPRVGALFNKYRQVWLLAMYRQRKLQDALDYLNEVERMKHFDFEDWRKRYLRWMNHNKARIMDFFRRQDHDRDGRVTRQEFIDGIIQSKFPTSRLEMEAVADIFDRDGDGFINYKEFVAALRPDRDPKQETDSEKILDEVRRQVSKCTCMKQFKIHKIGEGKYRFGDSQKLRLVRILRSTVMVRVGGGWIALDEFLVKNDPCRAKGRTNMELREHFVLAAGVSQSMSGFVAKSPAGSSHSSGSSYSGKSTSGPITKIREKTVHQTPWKQTKVSPDGEVHQIMSHTDPDGGRVVKHKVTQELRGPRNISSPASRSSSRTSTGSGSRPTSRTGSEAPDDNPDMYTTVQSDSRNAGGRTDTTVTYQTHVVQTRNVMLPTVASTKMSRIPKITPAKKK